MRPSYDDGRCAVWHARAEAWLPTLEAASVDLILTDPPFCGVKDEDWDRQWTDEAHYLRWLGGIADEWRRVLKPNGSLYCFASPQLAARVEGLLSERFTVLNSIRWLKEDGWHQKAEKEALRAYLSPWEAIVFCEHPAELYGGADRTAHIAAYSASPVALSLRQARESAGLKATEVDVALGYVRKADPTKGTELCRRWEEGSSTPSWENIGRVMALCGVPFDAVALRRAQDAYMEHAEQSFRARREEYDDLRRPFALSSRTDWSDVWRFATVPPGPGKHPCAKPVALLEHCITASTRPDGLVLDCFLGSGATLRAAKNLGRRGIGCEADARWARRAGERCRQEAFALGLEVA